VKDKGNGKLLTTRIAALWSRHMAAEAGC
jgi:hypothetical protein